MNEKCCICPHFNPKTFECEADPESDECLAEAIWRFQFGKD